MSRSLFKRNVYINGNTNHGAHTWILKTGIERSMIIMKCHDLDQYLKLSIESNPNPTIALTDVNGTELKYDTKLIQVKRCHDVDSFPQIQYKFEILQGGMDDE